MSQKTREKYGIRLPVMVDAGRGTGLTAAARGEFAREVEAAAPVWNGLRRLWMVDGVAVDPQPAAPSLSVEASLDSGRHYGPAAALPPSVKVSA